MLQSITSLAWLLYAVATHSLACAVDDPAAAARPLPRASVRFEQNSTDGDVEVVFAITGRSEGLTTLRVVSPDGRTVVDFHAPDNSTLGIRQFVFESPEPKDVASLKAAYPEGEYVFTAETASGARFRSKAGLSHSLPSPTSLVSPAAGARDVAVRGLQIRWDRVDDVAAYIVEIEEEKSTVKLTAKLPGSVAAFDVPNGFLRAGTEYHLALGTVAGNGNISFIETSFRTAARE